MAGPLKSWSYSTYNTFQKCPKQIYYKKVLKEPEPPRKIPEGKTEDALTRGSRIHDAAELYVTEGLELIPELHQFRIGFEAIRELQKNPDIDFAVEEDWAFTSSWTPTGWRSDDAWLRMKVDLLAIKDNEAILIDYKTGRKHGNEIAHMTQAQLYQLGTFIRYPEIDHIIVEFWYTDVGEISKSKFRREFGTKFMPLFNEKGNAITNEVRFDPKPSAFACKYCPYGSINGNSLCKASYTMRSK